MGEKALNWNEDQYYKGLKDDEEYDYNLNKALYKKPKEGERVIGRSGLPIHKKQITESWKRHKAIQKEERMKQKQEEKELKKPKEKLLKEGKPGFNSESAGKGESIISAGDGSDYIKNLYKTTKDALTHYEKGECEHSKKRQTEKDKVKKTIQTQSKPKRSSSKSDMVKNPKTGKLVKTIKVDPDFVRKKDRYEKEMEDYKANGEMDVYSYYPVGLLHNFDFPRTSYIQEKIFDDHECDAIINLWDTMGEGFNRDKNGKKFGTEISYSKRDGENFRKCDIKWVGQGNWRQDKGADREKDNIKFVWVFERIREYIQAINDEHFKFDLTNPIIFQDIQYTRYKPGDYYSEHMDWSPGTSLDVRKLSFSINLSDPSTFEGGGLTIDGRKVNNERGLITVFPSFTHHEAIKVTEGHRYVLISWVVGPTFR